MSDWIECDKILPADGKLVESKIDNANGCRNVQSLRRRGRLWFLPDMQLYVYYTPTHWRPMGAMQTGATA